MIRKSSRWLSLSAALCVAASGMTGCSSKPLLSNLRIPGSKSGMEEKVAASKQAEKPSLSQKESSKLLAEAQAFEKRGDFTNAAKSYRRYFEQQGTISPIERQKNASALKSEKTAVAEKAPEKSPVGDNSRPTIRPVTKSQQQPSSTLTSDEPQDPWADLESRPVVTPQRSASDRLEPAKVVADTKVVRKSPVQNADAVERPAWAAEDKAPESAQKKPAQPVVTSEDLDDLLDLDEGQLDWGDEDAAVTAAESREAAPSLNQESAVSKTTAEALPHFDLFGSGESESPAAAPAEAESVVAVPAEADLLEPLQADLAVTESQTPDAAESDAPMFEPGPVKAAVAVTADSAEDLTPPVMDDTVETDSNPPLSVAELCKQCEPWIYSWAVKLESTDPAIRKEALNQLANSGSAARSAGLAVRASLADVDPLVQCHAAWALWEIENDSTASVDILSTLVNSPKSEVAQLACYMLGDIGSPADAAVDELITLRDHADVETRIHAAEALVRIQGSDDRSVQILCDGLKSPSAQERWLATVALGRCRGAHSGLAVEALTKCLSDVDVDVRCAAALSLGGLGAEARSAVSALEKVLHGDDPVASDAANAALACIKR